MEHFGDFEFFTALACSLEAGQGYANEFVEQFDDFPDQEGTNSFYGDDEEDVEPMTLEEKEDLLRGIERLPPQYLRGLCKVINDLIQENVEHINLGRLPAAMLRNLNRYVRKQTNIVFQAEQPGQEQV